MVAEPNRDRVTDLARLAETLATAFGMVPVGRDRWWSGHHELRLTPDGAAVVLRRRGPVTVYAVRFRRGLLGELRTAVTGTLPSRVIADLTRADQMTGGQLRHWLEERYGGGDE